ncbi:TonB-dependent receptor [Pelagicoccus sp. NFK12]|uniref:TonB-dependent receptor n=1 Tax=Pelagicoccus enzymogenes TaxID=2773457 RepID=A0A927F554_9BACT|nr:TonB-dependent receptor plug domain-containing protein [Pelagicoccus enzymogenes]MBD5778357.1 TonB-dependent receptor [Pelagicoccus enzymogenes]
MIKIPPGKNRYTGAIIASVLLPTIGYSQSEPDVSDEEVFTLSPFEISGDANSGYSTQATLAGNRLKTDLKDLGTSLSVYNEQFLDDVGATDNSTLLKYTLGTEVGGVYGNYSGSGGGTNPDSNAALNPQSTNRVRGLVGADNTRDLYLSSIPWDGYNVDGVDIQRGPNAILFGQGSPGGVINTRMKQASWQDAGEVAIRVDEFGSVRASVDINRVLIEDQLAVRFAAVDNNSKFKQDPAFDDIQRQYFAFRYEPSFLTSDNARTILRANYEMGDGESNRPRNLPPRDRISPWFTELNNELYDVAWGNDNHWQIPGRGAAANQDGETPANPNPNYVEWIGNATNGTGYAGYFGGSIFSYLPGESQPVLGLAPNAVAYLGLSPDAADEETGVIDLEGGRDGNIFGLADGNPHGLPGYRDYAQYKGLPFASLTKDKFITDPAIFDFYNYLIDGDIKREWQNFDSLDLSLSQTFFGDTMGFDIGYHKESYLSGGYNPVSDTIHIDVNSRFADGTNTPETGWYTDGTVNPGAGRPFVRLGNAKGESVTDRESWRATAFVSHDFDKGDNNWITRLLGKHTVTGMASKDDYLRTSQRWRSSTFIGDYYGLGQFEDIKANNGRFWADFVPMQNVYIGPNLQGASLGQDLGIRPPMVAPQFSDTMTLRYFDSTWNKPINPLLEDGSANPAYVDPGAIWYNQVTAGTADGPIESTQSENPANYVGWVTRDVQLMTDADPRNRDFLTESREWDDRYNEATAIVWQGKLWDGSLVATAGIRNDEVGQVRTTWNTDDSTEYPTEIPYTVNETGPFKEESKSWGLVAHTNDLPFIGGLMDNLPVNVSLSYNKSNNFQTGQVFVDYWGQPLPLPEGNTEDIGLMVATKDGKYSLRLNQFESDVKNNVGTGLAFWLYGNNIGIYAQAYHQFKNNYQYRSQPNNGPTYGDGTISDLPVPTDEEPNPRWSFDYQPLNGQTVAEAEALETAVIAAYDQWLEEMAPLPQMMAEAWSFAWDGSDFTEAGLPFRFTDDIKAEGYELELHAQITDNWRMTMNASKIKSYRDNLGKTLAPGGEMTMIEYLLDFNDRMNTTAMGDLRIWGSGSTANARDNWNGYADGDIKARLAEEGTVVPENRLWHVNFVTNYDFGDGKFKGLSVGGSARYQSASTLAYKPYYEVSEFTGREFLAYDLDTPYKDDYQMDFDLWVGYGKPIFNDRVDWRIQMNISNVGVGDELVPITVQPDGTPAAYRIKAPQQIFLTNTFKF